jgi:hypothetical protein
MSDQSQPRAGQEPDEGRRRGMRRLSKPVIVAFLVGVAVVLGGVIFAVSGGADDDRKASIASDSWVSINDVSVTEGSSGSHLVEFIITRSGSTSATATVNWATYYGSANSGDFSSKSGRVLFAPEDKSERIYVSIYGDTQTERDETFSVRLSLPDGTSILKEIGVGTIVTDETGLAVSDATVAEGNSGSTVAEFTITRTGPITGTSSAPLNVGGVTATSGSDFTPPSSRTVQFAAGETSKKVSVTVLGDTVAESNESFEVTLVSPITGAGTVDGTGTGTITNDDGTPARSQVSINDVSVIEGDSGGKSLGFTVTRSGSISGDAAVSWSLSYSTATSSDVGVTSGKVTFYSGGATSKTLYVLIHGDTVREANEYFHVKLLSSPNIDILKGTGLGIINNDD